MSLPLQFIDGPKSITRIMRLETASVGPRAGNGTMQYVDREGADAPGAVVAFVVLIHLVVEVRTKMGTRVESRGAEILFDGERWAEMVAYDEYGINDAFKLTTGDRDFLKQEISGQLAV